ncbi:MAG TPA: nitroreductase family protein [Nitrospiraceae bacterium]|jgi:nitroreductase|nr:nitroreductase family protein [Nitrospiraceae bacterium]
MMEKPADTAHPIHDLLKRRWSPRAFSDKPVEPETLCRLWEAARWAPSCFNDQPWYFLVATKQDRADYDRMLGCLNEGNAVWARHAPVLMISVARTTFQHDGGPNRHALHDVGQAVAGLTLQATALGLFVHQMAGFFPEKVRQAYAVPEGFEPVAAIALGYPGDPALLPEKLRQREVAPRSRRPLEDFVFSGQWGRTSPLVSRS